MAETNLDRSFLSSERTSVMAPHDGSPTSDRWRPSRLLLSAGFSGAHPALAMTSAGARGRTLEQMAEVLHFPLPQERLHPAAGALRGRLVGLCEIRAREVALALHHGVRGRIEVG